MSAPRRVTCDVDIDAMTEADARRWLVRNDREAERFWASRPEGDLREAVRDNCRSFGFDDCPVCGEDHQGDVPLACATGDGY